MDTSRSSPNDAPATTNVELPLLFSPEVKPAEQPELTLSPLLGTAWKGIAAKVTRTSWAECAAALERLVNDQLIGNRYADRNLLIVKMWADRDRADTTALDKICRYAKASRWVVQWVLKTARKGGYDRLVRERKPGRRGKRQQVLEALRNGIPPSEVARLFSVHRTSVLRAQQQLNSLQGRAA